MKYLIVVLTAGFAAAQTPTVADARAFLDRVNRVQKANGTDGSRAGWVAETYITDDSQAVRAVISARNAAQTKQFITESHRFDGLELPPDLARQMMLLRRNAPAVPSDPALALETTQTTAQLSGMYGRGKYCDNGKCLGIDDLDVSMAKSRDAGELLKIWTGWHKVGAPMRDKYTRFVELSNMGARELGQADTGALWRSRYDMPEKDFRDMIERTWGQLEPLYRELHAYVRNRLIAKYGAAAQRADGMIPAHLLGNMWAQEWGNIYDLAAPASSPETYDIEAALKGKIPHSESTNRERQFEAARELAAYGDRFYQSIGLAPLPSTFWERSQFVRPLERDAECHASAWDIDGDLDLRIKMCIHIDADNFRTVHHEEGHLEYDRAYSGQPYVFRGAANDGFHEAIGDAIALSITPDYLRTMGLIDRIPPPEADIPLLLRTALDKVAFLPFGLMIDKWRWQVFSGETKPVDYNRAWWALREQYQGIAPPLARSEADFDPGAKYHIPGNTPYARYYLAAIYQFQFYKAMCDAAGYKGPLNRCSFYGSKAAGAKLEKMLAAGQSQPWQVTLKQMTGTDQLDAGPMLEYFAPLYRWLKQQNAANKAAPGWKVAADPLKP
jgi:peptidyl-dipeptidase A